MEWYKYKEYQWKEINVYELLIYGMFLILEYYIVC